MALSVQEFRPKPLNKFLFKTKFLFKPPCTILSHVKPKLFSVTLFMLRAWQLVKYTGNELYFQNHIGFTMIKPLFFNYDVIFAEKKAKNSDNNFHGLQKRSHNSKVTQGW